MAIRYNNRINPVAGANPTLTLPFYQAGTLLLIVSATSTNISTPSGWTLATTFTSPDIIIFYKFASASESNVTLSGGDAASMTVMLSYQYVDEFDKVSARTTATGINITASTLSVNNNDEIIIYCFGIAAGTNSGIAGPTGTTNRLAAIASTTQVGLSISDEIYTGTGTTPSSRLATTGGPSTTWFVRTIAFTANRGYFFGAL